MPLLDEKARDVTLAFDDLFVALTMFHNSSRRFEDRAAESSCHYHEYAIDLASRDHLDLSAICHYGAASCDHALTRLHSVRHGHCATVCLAQLHVAKACDLIGKPYVFGSNGPNSYDCSGLTQEAWGSVGVHLEHYTKDQWGSTTPISRAELKPGDLVFYYSDLHHVALYIGGGKVVHAPHTGDHVRMASIERGPIAGYRRPG